MLRMLPRTVKARVKLKFITMSKTPKTSARVKLAISHWAGLIPVDAVLSSCDGPRQGYYKVETKGLMEEAMMFDMKKLQNPNFFSLVDCTSGNLRLVCVLLTSRIFPTEVAESFLDACAGTRTLATTAVLFSPSLIS